MSKDWTDAERRDAAVRGIAMHDGSYPCATRADVQRAVATIEQAKDKAVAMVHIIGRAKSLQCTDELPADWADSTRMGDKLAGTVKTPFEASAHVLAHRLVLAKSAEARASVEQDAKILVRDIGAVEAIKRAMRAPQSFLRLGA